MNSFRTPISSIVAVNGKLFMSMICGIASVWLWPSSIEWSGLGLVSVLLGLSAFGSLVSALRAIAKIYAREKEIARFAATSRAPDPSDLASADALRNAGMFDE